MPEADNIVLIGMPGCGKSTVGVVLAKLMSHGFVDTDVLIQQREGRSLQTIVEERGYQALRSIEEQVLLDLDVTHCVVATGGSAVYSDVAMAHLKKRGLAVFLDVDLARLNARVTNLGTRGLARPPDQTFAQVFAERRPLYLKHADVVIGCGDMNHEAVAALVVRERGL